MAARNNTVEKKLIRHFNPEDQLYQTAATGSSPQIYSGEFYRKTFNNNNFLDLLLVKCIKLNGNNTRRTNQYFKRWLIRAILGCGHRLFRIISLIKIEEMSLVSEAFSVTSLFSVAKSFVPFIMANMSISGHQRSFLALLRVPSRLKLGA